MAQYGKISGTVTDNQGNPLSGAIVEVRRQGAFVTSTQAGPVYTVNDPGGALSGDQVRVNTLSGPTRQVTGVTATTITTGGAGLGTLNNNDRITIVSTLPTLYADGKAAETKANPLTTDASGFWYAWAEIRPYDIIETYGSTVRLKTDVVPEGDEYVLSNLFTGAGVVAWFRSTIRTLTSGYLVDYNNPVGVTKFRVDYAGNVDMTGSLAAAGNLSGVNATLTGDLTVDDITADDITAQDIINTGSFTYSGATGSFSLTAGSIETADLANQATMITRTADGTADQTFNAAAYNTANYVDVTGCSVTFTPASSASEIVVMAHCPSKATGAAALDGWWAIRDGSANILHQSEQSIPASAKDAGPTLIYRVTGLTGSQTFKVSGQCVTNNMDIKNATWVAGQKTRIVVMEFKK